MAWIESHQSLALHPKLTRLARSLRVRRSTAIGMLHLLWWWAFDITQDGHIDTTAKDLAALMDWPKNPDTLLQSLIENRWIDQRNDQLFIHDWEDYTEKLSEKRANDRERQRKHRAMVASKEADITRDSHKAVTPSRAREPYRTVPTVPTVPTEKDKKETILPNWINPETWTAFMEIRKAKKAPGTEHAKTLLFKALERMKIAGDDPNEVLEQSIMNGWKGVFPLGGNNGRARTDSGNLAKSSRAIPTHYTTPEDARKQWIAAEDARRQPPVDAGPG